MEDDLTLAAWRRRQAASGKWVQQPFLKLFRFPTAPKDLEKAMIESIEFSNVKALRQTTLPLAPFTLLLGPNGSGKTTVLQALESIASVAAGATGLPRASLALAPFDRSSLSSITSAGGNSVPEIKLRLRLKMQLILATYQWLPNANQPGLQFNDEDGNPLQQPLLGAAHRWLARMQMYALHSGSISAPANVGSGPLHSNGTGLAAVLDDLRDNHVDRWELLLAEMRRWLPEYRNIEFDKPVQGQKVIVLRTKTGGHRIPARDLSQGTLVALALLTLAYLPEPPSLVGLEEIDRGLHPRLLRHLQDALYRLSYPESCGELRPPIQVIATTHSPYLLDLYRDHPEEVVLAEKVGLEVEMKRLTDTPHFQEVLGDSPLSEVWYSGILGGVSVKP